MSVGNGLSNGSGGPIPEIGGDETPPSGVSISREQGVFTASQEVKEQTVNRLIARYDARWRALSEVSTSVRTQLEHVGLPLISHRDAAPLPTKVGDRFAGWTYCVYHDYTTDQHHAALVFGDLSNGALGDGQDVLVRVHSSNFHHDTAFGNRSDSRDRLENSMRQIVEAGRGVVLYLEQDGRGHGSEGNIKALNERFGFDASGIIKPKIHPVSGAAVTLEESYRLAQLAHETRDYVVAGHILLDLGVRSAVVLSDNFEKLRGISRSIPARLVDKSLTMSPVDHPSVAIGRTSVPTVAVDTQPLGIRGLATVAEVPEADLEAALRTRLRAYCREMEEDARQPWEQVAAAKELLRQTGRKLVSRRGLAPFPTDHGDWTVVAFGDYTTGYVHRALVYGDLASGALGDGEEVLMRVHSSCLTNEVLQATNCECRSELREAMKRIQEEGRGVIFYMVQEGRGTGPHGKLAQLRNMFEFSPSGEQASRVVPRRDDHGHIIQTARAYELASFPPEIRDYAVAAEMARDLGIRSVRMMTNNPGKIAQMEEAGLVVSPEKIIVDLSAEADPECLVRELLDKRHSLGHRITDDDLRPFVGG